MISSALLSPVLLKIIQKIEQPSAGELLLPKNIAFGYVEQITPNFTDQSGAERFLRALSRALACDPDILCLDEPTNHLDSLNRRSFLAMLENYEKTLLVISHDSSLHRIIRRFYEQAYESS